MSAVNITPLMFQCAAQSPDRQRRQARRASRPAAAVSMLCVSCSAVQQLFSLSLILKMFVYFRGDTFKAGWGTSQVSLVIIKSAKKTLRVTMAAKIATYLSASHYFDLSINGNEKMCPKEDFRVDWHLKATNDALETSQEDVKKLAGGR